MESKIKKWYVENKEDYYKFMKWIPEEADIVAIENLYLFEGIHRCFRCGKETRVIGFGIDKYINVCFIEDLEEDRDYINDGLNNEDIHIVGPIYPIPEKILEYLTDKYNYKMRYSKTTGDSAMRNCCDHCDVLQGDFFLFDEVDSPFFIDNDEKLKRLKIFRIKLKHDLPLQAAMGFASYDELFKEKCEIVDLDIEI